MNDNAGRAFTFRGVEYRMPLADLAIAGAYGRTWYTRAANSIETYAYLADLDREYVASVVAILSPRVSVAFNVVLADRYLRTGKADGAMGGRIDALDQYERTGHFNGPKVNAFKLAILGDPRACVIDSWMYRVAGDGRYPTKLAYVDACDRVRAVALELGWPISETQAAIWMGVRELVGFKTEGALLMPKVAQ